MADSERPQGRDLIISEGIASVWFFHLSERQTPTRALCGAQTFATLIPLRTWGQRGHLNERYCTKCVETVE